MSCNYYVIFYNLRMNLKFSLIEFILALILSPIVFYIIVGAAKLFGAKYQISVGESFIIWLLLAILIKLSLKKK